MNKDAQLKRLLKRNRDQQQKLKRLKKMLRAYVTGWEQYAATFKK